MSLSRAWISRRVTPLHRRGTMPKMRQSQDSDRSPRLSWRRRGMIGLAAAGFLLGSARARADCVGAQAYVQDAAERSLAVLNVPGASEEQRLAGMNRLLFELADVPLIARLVLGRHWKAASEPQRAAYLDAFRIYALDSLAYRFARLGGGVGFRPLGRCVAEGSDALIPTEVTLPNRPEPTRIEWRVRETKGVYRLIDVAVEGVSLVVSNRSEFDSVVNRQGLDALIAQIRGKNEPRP
jgi:phospholipid transport system substrate-binding protein